MTDQTDNLDSRRRFLVGLGGVAVSVAAAVTARGAAPRSKLRLGGPIFLKSEDPVELARAHRAMGYNAAYCPQASVAESERIKAIERAFAAENVVIAEVGAWRNMLEADEGKRRGKLQYLSGRPAIHAAGGARHTAHIARSCD